MNTIHKTGRNKTHALLLKFEKWPKGLWLFSKAICFKAPYFGSIKPLFTEIRPGYGKATIKKKRRVHNHISTVHAIAMANLCEFVGGTLMEVSIAKNMRWIPTGMDIRYLAKAETDVTATCEIDDIEWQTTRDVVLIVDVHDTKGQLVANAKIPMYVSPKPQK